MISNPPSLSVIIPTYNSREETLNTLQSVLMQSGNFEIIIVDDASTPAFFLPDNLSTGISVRLIRHQTNKGAAAARNSGINSARGEWICLLDGDDLMRPKTLSKRLDFVLHHDQNGHHNRLTVYACGWQDTRPHWRNDPVRLPNNGKSLEDFCSGCWFSPGSTLIAHNQMFKQHIGNFDESLRRLEDMDWFIRLGKAGGQLLVQPLIGLDILPGNKPSLEITLQAGQQMLEKHKELQQLHPAAFKRLKAYLNLEFTTYAARERDYFKAATWFLRSLVFAPRLRRHLSPGWRRSDQRNKPSRQ